MTVESKKAKTIIKYPRKRKKQKIAENNLKLLLSTRFDFDPEEILDKFLLFNLKKRSEEKIFDLILEKIPDKSSIYYIEHREGTNACRIRKDPKQDKKDELKTMLETVDRGIKRATSKSKLSQLKGIRTQLIRNTKIWGENVLTMNELKKLFLNLQTDAKVFCFQKKI